MRARVRVRSHPSAAPATAGAAENSTMASDTPAVFAGESPAAGGGIPTRSLTASYSMLSASDAMPSANTRSGSRCP